MYPDSPVAEEQCEGHGGDQGELEPGVEVVAEDGEDHERDGEEEADHHPRPRPVRRPHHLQTCTTIKVSTTFRGGFHNIRRSFSLLTINAQRYYFKWAFKHGLIN